MLLFDRNKNKKLMLRNFLTFIIYESNKSKSIPPVPRSSALRYYLYLSLNAPKSLTKKLCGKLFSYLKR
ncbi:hypothetical protein BpHYR1_053648 [Brachionus plicatilis]|uniref:Uncharacterized protein n=1 Tax=Brachionus plicatilis TaxID=10195 RepID=A0A3M7RSL5_BRAPC|nr:hypothetical protein BpHYR1_053648 [Brachionus plicatilis]